MNRVQRRSSVGVVVAAGVLLAAAFGLSAGAAAQSRQTPPPVVSAPEPAAEPPAEAPIDPEAWGREVVRIGQDYTLNARDAVGQVIGVAAMIVAGLALAVAAPDVEALVASSRCRFERWWRCGIR